MAKVDLVIAGLGVVALIVTGLGIVLYESGETEYNVLEATASLDAQGPTAATPGGTDFTFATPDNTFGATFDISVATVGQALPGSSGTIAVTLTGPDGSTVEVVESFTPGTTATLSISNEAAWMEMPDGFSGDEAEKDANTMTWGDMTVTVAVNSQGGVPVPLPVGGPSFEATVSGSAMTYQFVSDSPDPEAA